MLTTLNRLDDRISTTIPIEKFKNLVRSLFQHLANVPAKMLANGYRLHLANVLKWTLQNTSPTVIKVIIGDGNRLRQDHCNL